MGDRGNIHVVDTGVYLYTHWDGSDLPIVVKKALARKARWDDPCYLTRILFEELTADDKGGETGFGIDSKMGDNEHPVVEVRVNQKTISFYRDIKWSFVEYINTSDEILLAKFLEKKR